MREECGTGAAFAFETPCCAECCRNHIMTAPMGAGSLPFKGCVFAKKLANLPNLTHPFKSKQASTCEEEKEAASTLWAGHRPRMLNTKELQLGASTARNFFTPLCNSELWH